MDFRDRALKAADYKCYQCGSDVDHRTAMFSHIIPKKNGGGKSDDNIQVSCYKCNLLKFETLFSAFTSPAVESGVRLWIHSYLKHPVRTISISIILSIVSVISIYQLTEYMDSKSVTQPLNTDFKAQLDKLDDTEDSLKALLSFVQNQRETTALNEQRIQQLENEKSRLEPLVNADKETVIALFTEQELRVSANASKERWFGFGLGVVASIVASFVIAIGNYFLKLQLRKKSIKRN